MTSDFEERLRIANEAVASVDAWQSTRPLTRRTLRRTNLGVALALVAEWIEGE